MTVAIQPMGSFRFFFSEGEWSNRFNCYGVWRSRFGEEGPYEALNALAGYTRAGFQIPVKDNYDVGGLELELLVNRVHEVTVLFSGTTPAAVAAAFNSAMPSVLEAQVLPDGGVLVETVEVGHAATILATNSDAWVRLFQTKTYFYGFSAYPALVPGVESYQLVDPSAQEGWYYKTRYCHRVDGSLSEFSAAVPAGANVGVDPSELIKGEVCVIDPQGRPIQNVMILLDVQADPANPNMLPTQIQRLTDVSGYASILVRRGVTAVVSVAGTNMSREILVPSTGDVFDLMDPSLSTQPDAYMVQVPDVRVGERRSM